MFEAFGDVVNHGARALMNGINSHTKVTQKTSLFPGRTLLEGAICEEGDIWQKLNAALLWSWAFQSPE